MGCMELTLPDGLRNLISLRHIHYDFHGHQPVDLRHLTSLQTLRVFVVGGSAREHRIDELKCLNQPCGELHICQLGRVKDKNEAREANLCDQSKLSKLILEWSSTRESYGNDGEVLENLQPHPNLQSLIIRNYVGENFPSWMLRPVHGSSTSLLLLNNLMDLELIDCIKIKNLPTLGQLHNLKILTLKKLWNVKCMGNEFYGDESSHDKKEAIIVFPALQRFTLLVMENLEEWRAMVAKVMFPCLEELDISVCPLLKSVPLTGQCLYLEKLRIEHCLNLSSIGTGLATSLHLKELRLIGCSILCSIPNLKGFSALQSLYVYSCHELEIVPIRGRCSSLEKLCIYNCSKLSKIGDGLSTSTCLKELSLEECPCLSSVPITGRFDSLVKLRISECNKLSKIGDRDGVSTASCLKELSLDSCPNLSSFPTLEGLSCLQKLEVVCCSKLQRVPIAGPLPSLEIVHIEGCETKSNIEDVLPTSTSLKSLKIQDCKYLNSVPRMDGFSALEVLIIGKCPQLTSVPITGDFSSLLKFDISDCRELTYIGDGLSTSTGLKALNIRFCPALRSIPCIDGLSSLIKLDFTEVGEGSTCLSSNLLRSSTSLCYVTISGLPDLRKIPDDSFGSLTCLEKLKIGGFSEELEEFPGLNCIQHLGYLHLIGWEKLKSLPNQLQHLTTLRDLTIERFHGIEALPEWLGKLSSLEWLNIVACDNLIYLPSAEVMQSLPELKAFWVFECPQLETRCAKDNGPEWSKISHIPQILINRQWIQQYPAQFTD